MECLVGKCLLKETNHRLKKPSLRGKGKTHRFGEPSKLHKHLRQKHRIGRKK